jgi:tRNA pseudouridine55 synthase
LDGLLIVDKPAGPSSHDIVVRVRRSLREKRIGHTGTLDPMASGILALVLGRATRLARYLSADDKTYEGEIRLGVSTDTYDAKGAETGPLYEGALPDACAIDRALDPFRGTFMQQPPSFSAKMIDGTRSYKLARKAGGDKAGAGKPGAHIATMPAPAQVTARAIELLGVDGDRVRLRVECSTGFYIRSLAHDLGQALGTGAHLTSLRRTAAGSFTLAQSVPADLVDRRPEEAAAAVIPLAAMLPGLAAAVLSESGEHRVAHGRDLGPADVLERRPSVSAVRSERVEGRSQSLRSGVRLIDREGHLLGIAEEGGASGFLHPSVVLM